MEVFMNNCNCSGLLPLIFGYITGRNQDNSCGCDQNVMPIGNNGWNNDCWQIGRASCRERVS